jgi:hypothetical protein
MDRGIPHSLGILLHGVPGAGKTSTIKAIAKDTHRHIFNLSLRPYTSQRQLTNLFFNETVVVYGHDGTKQTLKIPMNRRVYVIEDIDCLTDVVLDRTITGGKQSNSKDGDAVTLSFLLNLLDGVLETPGRILVITSNFPDKLDKALVRPGRIDVTIEFKNTNREFILDMVNKFYSAEHTLEDIPEELDSIFTPAEVMESMCTHFKNPTNALKHMVGKIKAKVESKQGTVFDVSPITYISPATVITSPVTLTVTEEQKEEAKEEEIPQNIVISKAKKPEINYDAMKTPMKMPLNLENMWGNADFGDAQFMPGGHMPGDMGIRSPIDLNLRM